MKFSRWLLALIPALAAADPATLLEAARIAEARMDPLGALACFLQADKEQPDDPVILQKIARQYSDLVSDQAGDEAKRRFALTALGYAESAVKLAPDNPVNVLSLAVCHGKLALYSDTRTKVQYCRLVRAEAVRALELDPNYAWAHDVLGRWNYEVATLGASSRLFVGLFLGGLPPASTADAVRELTRATELEPTELNHWVELGFACAAAGERDAARRHWTRGLAMPTRGKNDEVAKQRARAALAALD